jgi:type I restriction enzyme S subunit
MSQILIPSLRFSDFNEEWKSKRYSEIFTTFKSGQTITSSQISELGDFPVYGGNGLRGYTDSFTHDGYYFLIGRQGALCGNINRVQGRIYISEHAIACQVEDELATEFYAQRLEQMNLNRFSESSAQPGLSVSKLLRFKLYIPTLSEQQKIASFLTSVDSKISQLTEKHRLLKEYKKGVMQQLFSQQLRFKDKDGKAFPEWVTQSLREVGCFSGGGTPSTDNDSFWGGDIPWISRIARLRRELKRG